MHAKRGSRRNKIKIYMASEEKNVMIETKRRNS